jgi:signal transduction histidine kinase
LIADANVAGTELLKTGKASLMRSSFARFVAPGSRRLFSSARKQALETGKKQRCELELIRKGGKHLFVQMESLAMSGRRGHGSRLRMAVIDITEQKRAESYRDFSIRILDRLNQPFDGRRLICDMLMMIKEFTGAEAVGIRLREGNDFPFHEASGFPPSFLESEKRLFSLDRAEGRLQDFGGGSFLRYMCGRIVCKLTDASLSVFTEKGSFWTNQLSALLAAPVSRERLGWVGNAGEAVSSEYESVAIISLRCGEEIIGLLQLQDRHPDCVTLELVHFLENIGASIGIAVKRFQTEVQLQQDNEEMDRRVEMRTRELRRANEELRKEIAERQRMETELVEQQHQLRALASELLMAEEKERRRMAAGLHDNVGTFLATSCLKLGNLAEAAPPEKATAIMDVINLIKRAIKETQTMTFELASPVLYELGLGEALDHLCEQMEEQYGLEIKLERDSRADVSDLDVRSVLYRGARELLFNIVKHSKARRARLVLKHLDSQVQLSVEDDGIGFDTAKAGRAFSANGGFGLFNLRQRLQYFGGHLQFSSSGKGVRITMMCPQQPAGNGKTVALNDRERNGKGLTETAQ